MNLTVTQCPLFAHAIDIASIKITTIDKIPNVLSTWKIVSLCALKKPIRLYTRNIPITTIARISSWLKEEFLLVKLPDAENL